MFFVTSCTDIALPTVSVGKTLREYITAYQSKAKSNQIKHISTILGLDKSKLRSRMASRITDENINEFGRFDELKNTADKTKAKAYFEKAENATIPLFRVNVKIDGLLRKFILEGGFDVDYEA